MTNPQTQRSRTLRADATPAERRLWYWLRKRPHGCKFRRQVPLGPYIVDFACYEARLVIEADGQFHADQPGDLVRQAWLEAAGWEVARYWNRDVRLNLEGVLADVTQQLMRRVALGRGHAQGPGAHVGHDDKRTDQDDDHGEPPLTTRNHSTRG